MSVSKLSANQSRKNQNSSIVLINQKENPSIMKTSNRLTYKKSRKPYKQRLSALSSGVPDRNRTCDVSLRRRTLYPTEVLGRMCGNYDLPLI